MHGKNSVASGLRGAADELTREQEVELARRWQSRRDRGAADLLARAHVGHVVAQAARYRGHGHLLGDLIGEGNVGIMMALDRFEPERGVRFGVYAAYWIKACIASYVRAGRGLRASGICLNRERARVTSELGPGEAADRVLAQRLHISVDRVKSALERIDIRFISLDGADGGPNSLEQLLAATDQEQELAKCQDARLLQLEVSRALDSLDARERYIAERRLMADPQDRPSLAELARHFRVSRERVGRLEARAKRKLRERMRVHE